MIPFAILSGKLTFSDNTRLEFRVLDLSAEGFTFRLSKQHHSQVITGITLNFYDFDRDQFTSCTLTDYTVCTEIPEEARDFEDFYTLYRVTTDQSDYADQTKKLTTSYLRYINLKLSGDDAALSEALTSYPAQSEAFFPKDIDHFRSHHLSFDQHLILPKRSSASCPQEIAISLMTTPLMAAFLQMSFSDFKALITKHYYKDMIPVHTLKVTHIYLGHPASLNLYPDTRSVDAAIQKAHDLGLIPVIVIPPLRGHQIETMTEWIQSWLPSLTKAYASTASCPEFLINDWGMAKWFHAHLQDQCHLILGTLLNKRRKDVRLPYKNNPERLKVLLYENSSNADFYQKALKKAYGIDSYAYDSSGYIQQIPQGLHELHLPYYLMNTEGFTAPSIRFYPSFLPMIGIDGNLWGLDTSLFTDTAYREAVLTSPIKRIVLEVI